MIPSENSGAEVETAEIAARLLERFAETVVQVLESMTDQRPSLKWERTAGPPAAAGEAGLLWWEQPFHISPAAKVWVAAPKSAWEYIGTLTLKAAGLETVTTEEAKNTWLEILGQSLSGVARAIGSAIGVEVNCETGTERPPGPEAGEWSTLAMSFAETAIEPLFVAFSTKLLQLVSSPGEVRPETPEVTVGPEPPPRETGEAGSDFALARSRTLPLLLDVDLPVSISFGKTLLAMKDILKLTTGSIIELNRGVNEPVEVLVNHCLVARGEVVVVDGNYGVRIAQIANRQDRLRSLR